MNLRTASFLAPALALGACSQPAAEAAPDATAAESAAVQTVEYRVTGIK